MRRYALIDPRRQRIATYKLPEALPAQAFSRTIGKHELTEDTLQEPWPDLVDIPRKLLTRPFDERHRPDFSPLPFDCQIIALKTDVSSLKGDEFRYPQAGRIQELQHGLIARAERP